MKKPLAFLMLILFLITNSGMAVTIHSCGGKIASINVIPSSKHKCICGKKKMKPGCCKSKTTTTLSAQKDLANTNQLSFKLVVPQLNLAIFSFNEVTRSVLVKKIATAFYSPPPDKSKIPIYLLDGVFLV